MEEEPEVERKGYLFVGTGTGGGKMKTKLRRKVNIFRKPLYPLRGSWNEGGPHKEKGGPTLIRSSLTKGDGLGAEGPVIGRGLNYYASREPLH